VIPIPWKVAMPVGLGVLVLVVMTVGSVMHFKYQLKVSWDKGGVDFRPAEVKP